MKSRFGRWAARRTACAKVSEPFGVESLERRDLLAADIGVEFNNFNVPSTLVPGDRFVAGIILTNNGPMNAAGQISISFYLSTDVTFSSDDLLCGSYPNQQIPGVFGNGEELFFSDNFTVPSNATPGNYFLLARIVPSASVGDNNQSNNVVASDNFFPLEIKFGNIPGRGNAILQLTDPEGTAVQFQLLDGGVGTVTRDSGGRFVVNITGSGANSRFGIATSGGDGVADIAQVTISGSMQSIAAVNTRLLGSLTVSGTLGSLTLGAVGGTSAEVSIIIGQAGVNTAITLGAVTNASVTTPGAIQSLTVASWTDTNASPTDLISAQWIGTLTSTGNFGASIRLSGRTGGPTLGSATIGESITGGTWGVIGRGGSIQTKTSAARWSASFTATLDSLASTRTLRGTIAAKNFLSITVGLDLLGAKILAGANLGEDAKLGGTGDDADRFAFGRIDSLTVARKVKGVIVGAGLDPVNGVLNDGDDRIKQPAKSRIGNVTIGSTMAPAARIVAGRFTGTVSVNGNTINPANDARFRVRDLVTPEAVIVNVNTGVTPSLITVRFTDNQAVLRSSIGDGDIRIDAPDNLFSVLVELVSVSRANDGTPISATYRFAPPDGTWDPADNGTYTVVLLAGAVTDTAGNAVNGGNPLTLGTFEVSV